MQVINLIKQGKTTKDKSHGTSKIHIHTDGLKDIHPFGLTTFLKGFKIMNGCADRIVFTGKKARDLALSSDHWSL